MDNFCDECFVKLLDKTGKFNIISISFLLLFFVFVFCNPNVHVAAREYSPLGDYLQMEKISPNWGTGARCINI